MLLPAGILFAAYRLHPAAGFLLEVCMCWQMLAAKSLKTESMKVYERLQEKDVEGARYAVSMIVGRDTAVLDEEGITKAAVETVAENTSDGVIAPLFYMMLAGGVGAYFYKAVNTLDSMVGYKNETYQYFGTCAAKLDDVVNYLPARLSAFFMILAAAVEGFAWKEAVRIYRRDRRNHASPNSAQTEAVMAGALEVQLAGNAWYFGKQYEKPTIGDAKRKIEAKDIQRANQLLYGTAVIAVMVFALLYAGIGL
ncbi:cobalamin biosynthesis protein CobD [gut metagenome]|uniref:Cobalamin biosynthesis protein CobD n=1 Tax=gut metagenome TaxID=749906 RepID=J9FV38_9ZZZZ